MQGPDRDYRWGFNLGLSDSWFQSILIVLRQNLASTTSKSCWEILGLTSRPLLPTAGENDGIRGITSVALPGPASHPRVGREQREAQGLHHLGFIGGPGLMDLGHCQKRKPRAGK